jgi:flagellar basal body rod protein FlgB
VIRRACGVYVSASAELIMQNIANANTTLHTVIHIAVRAVAFARALASG